MQTARAVQVAGTAPEFVSRGAMPAALLDTERTRLTAEAAGEPKNSKKPEDILAKIVEGRLNKALADRVLLEQPYLLDEDVTVGQHVAKVAKEVGAELRVARMAVKAVGDEGEAAGREPPKTMEKRTEKEELAAEQGGPGGSEAENYAAWKS